MKQVIGKLNITIYGVAQRYFQFLFTTSKPSRIEECVGNIDNVLFEDMKIFLDNPFTKLEVEEAVLQMSPLKSPDPDGMPALFYQKYWNIIGHDVTEVVLEFFE